MDPQPAAPPPPPQNIYSTPAETHNQPPAPVAQAQEKGMFSGRLNRIGYFLVSVYAMLYFLIPVVIELAVRRTNATPATVNIAVILIGFVGIFLIIPVGLGAGIRRWHDLNQSGWMVLLGFIPLVNIITAIVLLFVPGTKGPNTYGEPDSAPSRPKKVLFGKRA